MSSLSDDVYIEEKILKVTDFIVILTFDKVTWPKADHRRLIFVIVFNFTNRQFWNLKGTQFMVECEKEMHKVWKKKESLRGNYLRKLLVSVGALVELSVDVVWKILLRGDKRTFFSA